MLLGAFCVIALLVTGVLGCIGRSPLDAFAARSAKLVPLTPMEQAQKDLAGVTVTYQFGDQSEVLDSDRILSWLKEQEDGSVAIDEQQAKAFVKELAEKYDTAYTTRTFHTTGGRDIQIAQGDYGWRIDQEAETKHLLELLAAKQSAVCEPIYAQTAAVHAKNDWGTTYVEISLTDQYLWLYKDGHCIIESYFVSGNPTRGHATPKGIYGLTYKTRDATPHGARPSAARSTGITAPTAASTCRQPTPPRSTRTSTRTHRSSSTDPPANQTISQHPIPVIYKRPLKHCIAFQRSLCFLLVLFVFQLRQNWIYARIVLAAVSREIPLVLIIMS